MYRFYLTLLFFLSINCSLTFADTGRYGDPSYLAYLVNKAEKLRLYNHKSWHALIHFRPQAFRYNSSLGEADDDDFYFADDGKKNPQTELNATLAAFFQADAGDDHPQCKFPARFYWLNSLLKFDFKRMSKVSCPKFDAWFAEFNANSATLVFPASYLNSPSSMFGHTFLRMDPPNQTEANRLLAYTMNYAADVSASEGNVSLAYKGIFGGYPGIVILLPYHVKVKEYNDIESRDIWEYKLNLSPEEIAQISRHIWEISEINFDYFFFDENCAYRILALIDIVRPELDIMRNVRYRAIPADTVRELARVDLIESVMYRPSISTQLRNAIHQMSPDQQQFAERIVNGRLAPNSTELNLLPVQQRAQVLDFSFDYLRYRLTELEHQDDIKAVEKLKYDILVSRSATGRQVGFESVPVPAVRDDQGHATRRVTLGFGRLEATNYVNVTYQPAFHSLTDPPGGYIKGGQIEFFHAELRAYANEKIELETLKMFHITSLTPRDLFFKPTSWSARLGWRRRFNQEDRPLVFNLSGAGGNTYEVGNSLLFALAGLDVDLGKELKRGHDVGANLTLGWLNYGQFGQAKLSLSHNRFTVADKKHFNNVQFEYSYNIDNNSSLGFAIDRGKISGKYRTESQVSFKYYF